LKLLPNPFEDPKIRKVLAKEDRVEMVKELFKLLQKGGGGRGGEHIGGCGKGGGERGGKKK